VILLSDGVANVGNTGADSILNQLADYKKKGISISAIGVGMGNYNDALLEQIADKGDGNYYYINDFSEAKKVFYQQLSSTLEIVAKDAKVQVEFNPDSVLRYRLIGYENRQIADEEFRNDSKDAGEIGKGHEVTAIYELELKDKTKNIGKISLRYIKPGNDAATELSFDIGTNSLKNTFPDSSDAFKLGICAARFAQILKMTAPPPSIEKVYSIADSITTNDENVNDFKTILSNAKRLIELKQTK
jgi:Ca-activated chloride channel homolog